MRFLPLLLLPFLATPALARGGVGPGTSLSILRSHSSRATVEVANPGKRRARFFVGAYTLEGEEIEGVKVTPEFFSLSPNRARRVRIHNLPNQQLLLCSTVEVSASLHLRSCVQSPD